MGTLITLALTTALIVWTGFKFLFEYFAFFIIIITCVFLVEVFDISFLGALFLFNLIGISLCILIKKINPNTKFF